MQTWRDLGAGKSPFDQAWRSHGLSLHLQRTESTGLVRNADAQAGDVRREFDLCTQGVVGVKRVRQPSPNKGRIYQAFMGQEVRRSRARPSVWRTRSENEEVARREEEERFVVVVSSGVWTEVLDLVGREAWARARAPKDTEERSTFGP